jgi:hypothetical protein
MPESDDKGEDGDFEADVMENYYAHQKMPANPPPPVEESSSESADREYGQVVSGLSLLAFLVYLGITFYGNSEAGEFPVRTLTIAIALLVVGALGLIYSLRTGRRYKSVLDYEPTYFWGRTRNGGLVRGISQTIGMIGFWSSLSGITLSIIGWLHLTHRL